jgi:hypothetical protein
VSRNDINTSASASPSSSVAQPLLSSQPQARSHGGLLLLPDVVPPAPAAAPNRTAPPLNRAPPPLNRAPPPSMSSTGLLSAAALGHFRARDPKTSPAAAPSSPPPAGYLLLPRRCERRPPGAWRRGAAGSAGTGALCGWADCRDGACGWERGRRFFYWDLMWDPPSNAYILSKILKPPNANIWGRRE